MLVRKGFIGRSIALVSVAMLALGAGGCGRSDEDQVKATVEGLQENMVAADLEGVCEAMADRAKNQIGTVGHDRKPTTCERDLRALMRSANDSPSPFAKGKPPPGLRRAPKPKLMKVRVSGDEAVASMTLDGKPLDVPLAKEDGDWKLADFFTVTGPVRLDLR